MSGSLDRIEPVLDVHEIQGNILPGFNKDHETLLFFTIADPNQAEKWIGLISKNISTLYEVQNFNKVYKSTRQRMGKEPSGMVATWTNIAFSYLGMKKLVKNLDEVNLHLDRSFINGLNYAKSQALGDPADPSAEGNYNNWVVGAPKSIPDILLIVASDDPNILEAEVHSLIDSANSYGLTKIYDVTGHDLSYYGDKGKRGHEHFGFKDGVSQPGVRGRISDNPTDYLTPRLASSSPPDSHLPEFSSTGSRPLIAPGEFIIGYPTQNKNHPRKANAPDPSIPELLKNGSYLVFRRLRQDVEAFETFTSRESQRLSQTPGFSNMSADKFKAILVGRWPSGAPLSLSPEQDDPQLAADRDKNNMFGYDNDQQGYRTPVISHIRKVNPRDLHTDDGIAAHTLKRRILRRGIPFGSPLELSKRDPINGNRGLLFLSYQASIGDQFEFLAQKWMNSVLNPPNYTIPTNAIRPQDEETGINETGSGFDVLVGQKGGTDNRIRYAYLPAYMNNEAVEGRITTKGLSILDWVIPTGGGYFFSPSISSLRSILGSST
jgi:Dyp-type peroxidase family